MPFFGKTDYPRKRQREDDRRGPDFSRRKSDYVYRRNPDNESRPVSFDGYAEMVS